MQAKCCTADQAVLEKPFSVAHGITEMFQKLWTAVDAPVQTYQKAVSNLNSRIRAGKLLHSAAAFKQGSANFHYSVRSKELQSQVRYVN